MPRGSGTGRSKSRTPPTELTYGCHRSLPPQVGDETYPVHTGTEDRLGSQRPVEQARARDARPERQRDGRHPGRVVASSAPLPPGPSWRRSRPARPRATPPRTSRPASPASMPKWRTPSRGAGSPDISAVSGASTGRPASGNDAEPLWIRDERLRMRPGGRGINALRSSPCGVRVCRPLWHGPCSRARHEATRDIAPHARDPHPRHAVGERLRPRRERGPDPIALVRHGVVRLQPPKGRAFEKPASSTGWEARGARSAASPSRR